VIVANGLEKGRLGRAQLVSFSIASFVPAVGMTMMPMLMVSNAGIQAWPSALLSGLAIFCVGVAVVTFASRYVSTGSLYSYAGEVFGPWASYVTGASLLAGFIIQVAAIAGLTGIFLGSCLESLGMPESNGLLPQILIYAGVSGAGAWVAYRGIDISIHVAVGSAIASLPLMLLVTVVSAIHTGLDLHHQFSFEGLSAARILRGVASGAVFLVGFESCASLASETRDPTRNVPWAVMAAPVALGLLYLVATILQAPGLVAASSQLAKGVSPPAALALQAGLSRWIAESTNLVCAAAMFASMVGFLNYGARLILTLSRDGMLPCGVSAIDRRYQTPYVAIWVLAGVGLLLMSVLVSIRGTITAAYALIAELCVFVWIPPYVLITAGAVLLTLRGGTFQPVRVTAIVAGGASMLWAYINAVVNPAPDPVEAAMSWVAAIILLAAMGLFALIRRNRASV
jgi:amino acid transporter